MFNAEVVWHPGKEPKENPHFVVTNMKSQPAFVHKPVHCQRAPIKNRIKELLYRLNFDRISCKRFFDDQLRGLLTSCTYILFQKPRLKGREAGMANAQVSTLRVLKLAVWVKRYTRRVLTHLPDSAPRRHEWVRVAHALVAIPNCAVVAGTWSPKQLCQLLAMRYRTRKCENRPLFAPGTQENQSNGYRKNVRVSQTTCLLLNR